MLERRQALAVVAGAALAGCARKRPLTVGAKGSTEQAILAEVVAQHLEHRLGAQVERSLNLGGTLLAHQTLITGVVDLYPEYSGLAFAILFKLPHESDPAIVFERLRNEYRLRCAVEWLGPLGSSGGPVMVVRAEDARTSRLATLTDAAGYAPRWNLGVGREFIEQPALFRRLMSVYNLPLTAAPKALDAPALYKALADGEVNMVGGSPTDPQLAGPEFRVLDDDQGAFPPCQAGLAVRSEALTRYPAMGPALAQLTGKFSTEGLRKLSHEVEIERRSAAQIAAEFLREAGLAG